MKWILVFALMWILSFPLSPGLSEINECNGVITNLPCPGGTPLMKEKPHQPPTPEELEQRQRESWVNDLESARFRVRRQYGLDVDVSLTQSICRSSPLDECRGAILEKEREINSLVAVAISQGQASATPGSAELPPSSGDNIAISIVQDQSLWHEWDDFPAHIGPRRPHHPEHRPHIRHTDKGGGSARGTPTRSSSKGFSFGGANPGTPTAGAVSR